MLFFQLFYVFQKQFFSGLNAFNKHLMPASHSVIKIKLKANLSYGQQVLKKSHKKRTPEHIV